MEWSVYIILCQDGSLYTGISTDVQRRFQQHINGTGAKFFRSHQPERIVFIEAGHTRSTASAKENAIKKLSRRNKITRLNLKLAAINE